MQYNQPIMERVRPINGYPGKKDNMPTSKEQQRKKIIQAHAAACGEAVNCFIDRAVSETMQRDAGTAPAAPQASAESTQSVGAVLSLPSETLQAAEDAAIPPEIMQAARAETEMTGETIPEFITRAVEIATAADRRTRLPGRNPVEDWKKNIRKQQMLCLI